MSSIMWSVNNPQKSARNVILLTLDFVAIEEFDTGVIHEDGKLKCYMFCLFKLGGFVNQKSDLDIYKLIDYIGQTFEREAQDIFMNMGRRCMRPQGNNQCERAFSFHKCWKTQDPKVSGRLMELSVNYSNNFINLIGHHYLF